MAQTEYEKWLAVKEVEANRNSSTASLGTVKMLTYLHDSYDNVKVFSGDSLLIFRKSLPLNSVLRHHYDGVVDIWSMPGVYNG